MKARHVDRYLARLARLTALIAAFAILISFAPAALAAQDDDAGGSFVLHAGRILPVAADQPEVIEDGYIVVRNGVIETIGRDIDIPPDLRLISMPHAVVMPGLVAASTDLGGSHSGDESVGAGYRAVDTFDDFESYENLLSGGVTTVHINPGWHRLMTGQGAVVRLAGPIHDRTLVDSSDLTVNLGGAIYNPPGLVELLVPPTGDTPIEPAQPQRPSSRLGQYLALKQAIDAALADERDEYNMHLDALREQWTNDATLRIQVQDAADIAGALNFLRNTDRPGYIVGGTEAVRVADQMRASNVPLVYTVPESFQSPAGNVGANGDAFVPGLEDLSDLRDVTLAIAPGRGQPVNTLRLAAALATRAGLDDSQILAAITRVPAELLGVADRVGSLEAGKDADLVILSDHPLTTSAHVERVLVRGKTAYKPRRFRQAEKTDHDDERDLVSALVVRGGTIWLGPGEWLNDGEVLVEDGRITAVGRRVPHPPNATLIDAGPDAFITPGLIDSFGHLGLRGDQNATATQLSLSKIIGPADAGDLRVARHGVTTVMLAPYSFSGNGSQFSAIKTAGQDREERIVHPTAAVGFPGSAGRIRSRLEAGKKYLKEWEDYYKALEEWKKKKEEGTLTEEEKESQTEQVQQQEAREDPITGTWQIRAFGGPLPEEVEGKVAFRLDGANVEGRIVEPPIPIEVRITGTYDGESKITGEIDVDTGGMGKPTWEVTLDATDHFVGTVALAAVGEINVEGTRIDKGAVEFRVTRSRRRTRGEGGRPLPPKINEQLEPIRAVLEKKIPIAVHVTDARTVEAVLDQIVANYEIGVVFLDGRGVARYADRVAEAGIGVIVNADMTTRDRDEYLYQADSLARHSIPIAFQSNAEDGARALPIMALFAVERGLSAEDALAGLTVRAAEMYRIDDRVGSIAPGKDGDLVIFSGHPFDADSQIRHVIINGEEVQP